MPEQIISFRGSGLDRDSDIQNIRPGDSDYRLNCLNDVSIDGAVEDIHNIRGTTLTPFAQPAGTNQTIGSCRDDQNDAIIYFVWNSNGDHQIRRYFRASNTIQLILQSSLLNFQRNRKITHANVIQGLLYWTDGYFDSYEYGTNGILKFNPPRKINIDKAIKFTQSQAGGYTAVDFQVLDRVKYPPRFAPTLVYVDDVTLSYNYCFGKLFQFAYRYRYDDNERSVWSPLSKVALPVRTERYYEFGFENRIDVSINTGAEIVKDIELAVKVNGVYTIIAILEKYSSSGSVLIPSNITYTFNFFDTRKEGVLTTADFLREFDYVPQISYTQEITLNRIVDINFIEGYDRVDVDMSVEFERYDPNTYQSEFTQPVYQWGQGLNFPIKTFKSGGFYQIGIEYFDRASRKGDVNTTPSLLVQTPMYTTDLPIGANQFWPLRLNYQINHRPPAWATHYQIVLTKELSYTKKIVFFQQATNFDLVKKAIRIPEEVNYTFTEGDRVRIVGQTLLNDGYSNTVFWDKEHFPVPLDPYFAGQGFDWKVESFESDTGFIILDEGSGGPLTNLGVQGSNGDPIQQPLIATPSGDRWLFFVVELYNANQQISDDKIYFEIGENYEILNPHTANRVHQGQLANQNTSGTPAQGAINGFDAYLRIRNFNTSKILATHLCVRSTPPPLQQGTSLVEYNNTTGELKFWADVTKYFENITSVQFKKGKYDLDTSLFGYEEPLQEVSAVEVVDFGGNDFGAFPISDFRVISDPTYTVPVTIMKIIGSPSIATGMPFTLGVALQYPFRVWAEAEDYSDSYKSATYDDGKVNAVIENFARRHYIADGRFSEAIFQNSTTNGLSTVFAKSRFSLPEKFGEVTRTREVGFTLKVRQRNKNVSIYVGRKEFQDSVGNVDLIASDSVIGTINPSEEFYGSYHPAADIKSVRVSYFFDVSSGVVVRDGVNGMIAISGNKESADDPYKMSRHFRDLAKNIRDLGEANFNVIGVWDDATECYILTVQDNRKDILQSESLSQTVVFHEPTNRWKSFKSFVPEWYESIGQTLVSFVNGGLWLHYSNPVRNNFYGVQYEQVCSVISNIGVDSIKVFDNLDIYSNLGWWADGDPLGKDIEIPACAMYPSGMRSRLKPGRFVQKEGKFHASFLKDMNTPGFANPVLALQNGRALRGEGMRILLRNNHTEQVNLRSAVVHVTKSELSV